MIGANDREKVWRDRMLGILKQWLPIAVVALVLCCLVYLAAQQALRDGANDPQIQMAEDGASALATGSIPQSLLPAAPIDVGRSLAPFLIFYDDVGKVVASSASLHGQPPSPPAGVFEYVRKNGEERVTWQPEPGVRIASVIIRVNGSQSGFVLAGRSLREVEKRAARVMNEAGAALLFTLGISLAFVGFKEYQVKVEG
jgi:hypothetical protein